MRGAGPKSAWPWVFPATRTYVDRLTGEHLPCLWTPTVLLQSTPDRRPGAFGGEARSLEPAMVQRFGQVALGAFRNPLMGLLSALYLGA